MGSDLISWSPVVPGTLFVPGATTAGGSKLSGGPTADKGGAIGVANPTYAQISSGYTDWNQAIALINRRIVDFQSVFGGSLTALSFLNPGAKVKASDVVAIQTKVNQLLTLEGFLPSPFPRVPTSGKEPLGGDLESVRQALRISGTAFYVLSDLTSNWKQGVQTQQWKNSALVPIVGGNSSCDTIGINSGSKFRQLLDIPAPGWLNLVNQPTITLQVYFTSASGAPFTVEWFASDTDDYSAPATRGNNFNTLLASIASGFPLNVYQNLNCGSPIKYVNARGTHWSTILNTFEERTGNAAAKSAVTDGQSFAKVIQVNYP